MARIMGVSTTGASVQFEADATPADPTTSPWKSGTGGAAGLKSAVAVLGAATLNKESGNVTTEALTTAAGANYTLTLANSRIQANDLVFASVQNGTSTTGDPGVLSITPSVGQLVIKLRNHHASAALNGTLVISFFAFRI